MRTQTLSAFLFRMPAAGLVASIGVYRRLVSPVLLVTLGPNCRCRFAPTCSHYAAEAVRTHGALAGSWLALKRVAKCTPLHLGGVDLVPAPAPRCRRVASGIECTG